MSLALTSTEDQEIDDGGDDMTLFTKSVDENNEAKIRNQSLIEKKESDSEDIFALIARSDQDFEHDDCETHVLEIKNIQEDLHTLHKKEENASTYVYLDLKDHESLEVDDLMKQVLSINYEKYAP
ncbi:hypothetical protein HAX54_049746 [Datura stramonium]|uniref:Uncharacterized protein n=1 Tax=Datura stramonium TaxID=4076 RepID=A0ABS8WMV6_DATST|nr:hypothetical protein [Datura stramonium]